MFLVRPAFLRTLPRSGSRFLCFSTVSVLTLHEYLGVFCRPPRLVRRAFVAMPAPRVLRSARWVPVYDTASEMLLPPEIAAAQLAGDCNSTAPSRANRVMQTEANLGRQR
jgi:hypothetical protein